MNPIPETVICEMQAAVRRYRDAVTRAQAGVDARASLLDQAEQELRFAQTQLREGVAFLAEHNHEACDWWAEFGLEPQPAPQEKP